MKTLKKILKWVVSPIILALYLVTYNAYALHHWVMYLKYGGEWVRYIKGDRAAMEVILKELREIMEEKE